MDKAFLDEGYLPFDAFELAAANAPIDTAKKHIRATALTRLKQRDLGQVARRVLPALLRFKNK